MNVNSFQVLYPSFVDVNLPITLYIYVCIYMGCRSIIIYLVERDRSHHSFPFVCLNYIYIINEIILITYLIYIIQLSSKAMIC